MRVDSHLLAFSIKTATLPPPIFFPGVDLFQGSAPLHWTLYPGGPKRFLFSPSVGPKSALFQFPLPLVSFPVLSHRFLSLLSLFSWSRLLFCPSPAPSRFHCRPPSPSYVCSTDVNLIFKNLNQECQNNNPILIILRTPLTFFQLPCPFLPHCPPRPPRNSVP